MANAGKVTQSLATLKSRVIGDKRDKGWVIGVKRRKSWVIGGMQLGKRLFLPLVQNSVLSAELFRPSGLCKMFQNDEKTPHMTVIEDSWTTIQSNFSRRDLFEILGSESKAKPDLFTIFSVIITIT